MTSTATSTEPDVVSITQIRAAVLSLTNTLCVVQYATPVGFRSGAPRWMVVTEVPSYLRKEASFPCSTKYRPPGVEAANEGDCNKAVDNASPSVTPLTPERPAKIPTAHPS